MKKEILFVLLKDFADWEGAYIAPNLNAGVEPGSESKYIVKTVSVRKEPVVSIGGFKVLPDYGIHDIPADYAGIVGLIQGKTAGLKILTGSSKSQKCQDHQTEYREDHTHGRDSN